MREVIDSFYKDCIEPSLPEVPLGQQGPKKVSQWSTFSMTPGHDFRSIITHVVNPIRNYPQFHQTWVV